MGQLLATLELEVKKLAEVNDKKTSTCTIFLREAWENTGGREILLDMVLKGEVDSMEAFISRLVRRKRHGCPSPGDLNFCLMEDIPPCFDEALRVPRLLFDEAFHQRAIDVLHVMLDMWMD